MNRVKRYVLSLLIALVSLAASAVPAKPGLVRTLKLADGTSITARLVGDEHGHYWLGNDGKSYSQTTSEDVYEIVDVEAIRAKASVRRQQVNTHRIKRLAPRKVGDVGSITGKKKGLIILVNFSDVSFKSANNNALYQRIANEENFSYGNFKGSMYDYFYAQSDGLFQLTFDVAGPVTVSQKQSYYGGNDRQGYDKHPAEMVIEALKLVDNSVNFADYDWNGDGEVEQVYVVYAGQGEANGGTANTIWPHEYQLSAAKQQDGDGSGAQTLDGVKIDTYACGSELNEYKSIDGIGTMCHEFSHCLGYPDFYDTDYSGGQGMGDWDLMCAGSYNGDGYRPSGYTSYERWVAGWREPIELNSTTQINNMPALVDKSAQSYIIYNPGNHNEYFLLENRQQKGWDTDIPGSGLLILHVDYSPSAWAENTPNDDPSHQRMTWIPADNKYQYETYNGTKYYTIEGEANDPYPYGSNNSFSATSTPAAKFYNKNTDGSYYLDSSVENITQNANGTVSFKFKAAGGSDPDDPDDPDDPTGSDKYELVADAGTLAAGDKVLIAYVDGQKAQAMSTTQNTNNRSATSDVTLNSDGTLTPGTEAQVITLEKEGGNYLFNVGNGYLYAANSKYNYLRTEKTADANAKATITIADGKATITFQGSNTRNVIRYNPNNSNGSPLFSCYSSSSTTGSLPQIYRQKAIVVSIVGDVNNDGYITISDVTALVNIILGKDNTEPHQYNHVSADVNQDGNVTIADVTALVNIILGKK